MFCISHHYANIAAEGPPIWEKLEPHETRHFFLQYSIYNNCNITSKLHNHTQESMQGTKGLNSAD